MAKSPSFSRVNLGVGIILVLLAALVPSSTIVAHLATGSSLPFQQLLTGASLFRAGLGILGLTTMALGDRNLPIWRASLNEEANSKPTPKAALIILFALLLCATILRLYHLNSGLWLDEIVTDVLYARQPYGVIVTSFDSENQHFLYSLLAHSSYQLFGESPWALRLPAALFGIGSIGAMYLFGHEVASVKEALLGAALLTFSYTHIWFSQNARGYSGLLCLTLVASWLYLKALRTDRPRDWLFYALAIALGTYVHFTMLFVVAGHFVAYTGTLIARRNENWPGRWTGLFLGFGLGGLFVFQLYSLVLPQLVGLMGRENSVVAAWKSPLWTILEIAKGLQTNFTSAFVVVAAISVFAIGSISYLKTRPILIHLLLFPSILGFLVTTGLGHHLWPRFFLFTIGFGALTVIRGTTLLGKLVADQMQLRGVEGNLPGIALGCAIVATSAKSVPIAYGPKQDYQSAAAYVEAREQPGDVVVVTGLAAFPYENEYHKPWVDVESLEALNSARTHAKRTWLVYTFPTVLDAEQPEIMQSIKRDFRVEKQFPSTVDDGIVVVCRSDTAPGYVGSQ